MAGVGDLRLVTNFAELTSGITVLIKPCGWCGASHRGMIVEFLSSARVQTPRAVVYEPAWIVRPAPAHMACLVITRWDVQHRVVFRVLDGLENEKPVVKRRRRLNDDDDDGWMA